MANPPNGTFWSYYGKFWKQFYLDAAPWARDNIGWGMVMLIAPPLAAYIQRQMPIDWPMVRTTLWIYACAFGAYAAVHIVRTPWRLEQARKHEVQNKAHLELKFSQEPPHRFREAVLPNIHYRIEVYNQGPAMAENLEMWLLDITPRPQAPTFWPNYPYRVKRASNLEEEGIGRSLNPEHGELFELLEFWPIENNQLIVRGIDTKRGKAYSWPIEENEQMSLTYKVSCANAHPQTLIFSVRRDTGSSLLMERTN